MTNYEKIKAMTTTELAKFLEARTGCVYCNIAECCGDIYVCEKTHLKWLESEVEGNIAAEIAPVRHGTWLVNEFDELKCSVCGVVQEDDPNRTKYCPGCGAKMDGEEDTP